MLKISKNTKETKQIAKDFILKLRSQNKATIVGLYGDLGAGKTTFVSAVAKSLGVKRKVASPTFIIMKKYPLAYFGFKYLYHIDAYRLKNEKELLHLGWKEIISKQEHLVFIEWPERVLKALPKKHSKIEIVHTEGGYRKFRIKRA